VEWVRAKCHADTLLFGNPQFVRKYGLHPPLLHTPTFLGGFFPDGARSVVVNPRAEATVVGQTLSPAYPTTPGAFSTVLSGTQDAIVTRLNAAGSALVYSAFFGGLGNDLANSLAQGERDFATFGGSTSSTNLPTTVGAFDTTFNGGNDGFVTELDMLPTGVTSVGFSTPGCAGSLAMNVNSIPNIGNAGFALTCGNAPPNNTAGFVVLGRSLFSPPFVTGGVTLFPDPALGGLFGVSSDAIGSADYVFPIPNDVTLIGVVFFAQFAWTSGPTTPSPPCPVTGNSASNALQIVIQP